MFNEEAIDDIFLKQRGYITRVPSNKKGGNDHIGWVGFHCYGCVFDSRIGYGAFSVTYSTGQTNAVAENKSVDFFSHFFIERFWKKKNFNKPEVISVNGAPVEFKADLMPYVKKKGHPMRDPIMHLLGVQYAVAVSQNIRLM